MTREIAATCASPGCRRTPKKGSTYCYNHQNYGKSEYQREQEREAEITRLREYREARAWNNDYKRFQKEVDRELAETAEFREKYAHVGGGK